MSSNLNEEQIASRMETKNKPSITEWQTADKKHAGKHVGKKGSAGEQTAKTGQAGEKGTEEDQASQFPGLPAAVAADYRNINGIVVQKQGTVVYEQYFNGYGPSDPHHVASVTKSVISALIGIAIEAGYIKDADQQVTDFFPELVTKEDIARLKDITIRRLLTMTVPYPYPDWREPLDELCQQPDWPAYILSRMGRGGNVGEFKYSSGGAHLLSAILTRSTGVCASEFANERLFKPAGMRVIPDREMESFGYDELFGGKVTGWVKDPGGNSTGGWGLTLTPRDMAAFGRLYLDYGQAGGRHVLSKSWIDASTATNPNRYGYLWWLMEEEDIAAYSAMGDGGNVICCLPEHNVVTAIASSIVPDPLDRWAFIKKYILPNVMS